MNILLQAQEAIDLARFPEYLSIKCMSGRLWITCKGDPHDHLLKPGMEYRNTKREKVVVFALAEASFCVLNSAPQRQKVPTGRLLQV